MILRIPIKILISPNLGMYGKQSVKNQLCDVTKTAIPSSTKLFSTRNVISEFHEFLQHLKCQIYMLFLLSRMCFKLLEYSITRKKSLKILEKTDLENNIFK